ncbi:hypothetical protein SBOR_1239 [Sclerotinia borealis F-4128]|uniref:HNH nuclease domain-containing protein n=1 Tax=Sclerotinia borealis (strain F-4128) TaxID=1432307 RepID=W9CR88_SCLBF|nr:hypothetical protein SBOR_1239 [Sclerotinia borealis F-4128]
MSLTALDQDSVIEIRQEASSPTPLSPPLVSADPRHKILFRHPHYSDSTNVLLCLFAPDGLVGGIEYGVAHAACGLISGNQWNGWFTTTVDGAASTLTYGDILHERDYYFHLPESSFEIPYAIVPTFKEWSFPHDNLHPCWKTNQDHIPLFGRITAPSLFSAAVVARDRSCRMSGFSEGTQAAYLCPRSEKEWFKLNRMKRYNINPLLSTAQLMEDTANALLLRQDLHYQFDTHTFVFVPKKVRGKEETPFVTHLLVPSQELGILHHNMRLKPILDVDIAFLFARFAWSIFSLLSDFIDIGVKRTLIGTTISTESGDTNESVRHHKRQKDDDTAEIASEVSHGTETSKEGITTPTSTDHLNFLRIMWLMRERERSDPNKTWSEEEAWAHHIRNDDQVLDPRDTKRLFEFMGYEERECELKEDDPEKNDSVIED